MANRRLTVAELERANEVLEEIRGRLRALAGHDTELLFAYRRKVAKELTYDERGKPMQRRALKVRMRTAQGGVCPLCREALPQSYCVLDRFEAAKGYVEGNVRLICQPCDIEVQRSRSYA